MSMRYFVPLLSLILVAPALAADVPAFALPDARTNKTVSLQEFAKNKAVVVVFLGTACPVNNAYLPTLADLHKEYAAKGVVFVGINSVGIDTTRAVADHAKANEIPFPVLKDVGAKVADVFGAKRTPEAFLLAADGRVLYRGRIDDQFAIDVSRMQPTTTELKDAIDAVLAGKPVAVAATEAPGCLITRPTKPKETATVTYAKDVATILQKNCQECHRPGQIGPMPLLTYDDAAGWAEMIGEVVAEKRMPPWYADHRVGKFRNDRSLPAADRDTLLKWIDEGCAKGDEKDLPPPLKFSSDWRIGKPDVVFTMKEPTEVTAEMTRFGIPYQYFIIETNFKEDMWIEAAEARPGAPQVVHHIIAFIVPPRNTTDPAPPGPPLLPPFVPEAKKATILCGTAPGDMPLILPPGYARRIPAGAKIVLQMHYTPNGKEYSDRSSIGLRLAKKPPERQVLTVPVMQHRLNIPAGDADHRVESWGPLDMQTRQTGFTDDVVILGFMPHMHVRGKSFYIEAVTPDGKAEPLLNVPRFNFNWQNVYRYAEPKKLPKGTKIHCVAYFDNSKKNLNNPDPEKTVRWGDQTWQEMMIGWTDFAYDRKP